jgi:hypothetical protein
MFSARLAVNCNVGLSVATAVPLIENVSQVFAIIGFGEKQRLGLGRRFSKLAGVGRSRIRHFVSLKLRLQPGGAVEIAST